MRTLFALLVTVAAGSGTALADPTGLLVNGTLVKPLGGEGRVGQTSGAGGDILLLPTSSWLVQIGGAGNQSMAGLGWNGALHASVVQYAAEGEPPASLDFRAATLEGDGALHIELAP